MSLPRLFPLPLYTYPIVSPTINHQSRVHVPEFSELIKNHLDMAIQYVQTWMPVVAAQQLTKHKEDEKELLEKWISVAEYQ